MSRGRLPAYHFDWVEEYGACRGDRRMFDSTAPKDVERARRICRRCTVRDDCIARAMGMPELEGTWGAVTAAERVVLRRVLGGKRAKENHPLREGKG